MNNIKIDQQKFPTIYNFLNGLEYRPFLYKGGGEIKIKKENRGKFTKYCEGKVTQECINKAKKSGDPKLIKRATFAENSRKWKK